MDFLEELKNNVAKIQGDMAAYRREYPVPIAVSASPRGYEQLKRLSPTKPNTQSLPFEPLAALSPLGTVRVYIWDRQPEPIKAYYDKEEFKRWFDAYANPGDLMLID